MNVFHRRQALGRAAGGAACATCCAIPMLILTGAVSVATLAAVGFSTAAVVTIAAVAVAVLGGRTPPVTTRQRRCLAVGGAALGAMAWYQGFEHTLFIVTAVTLLTLSALLVVAEPSLRPLRTAP